MARKGQAAALGAVAIGIGVLGPTAFAYRETVREDWHIMKLRTARGADRDQAARTLADMGSLRAVPHLVHLIRLDESESMVMGHFSVVTRRCSRGAPVRIEKQPVRQATPLVFALWRIGGLDLGKVEKLLALDPNNLRMRQVLCGMLDRTGPSVVEDGSR